MTLALIGGRAEAAWPLDLQTGTFISVGTVELRDRDFEVHEHPHPGMSFATGGSYELSDRVDLSALLAHSANLGEDSVSAWSVTGGARAFLLPPAYRLRPWLGGQLGWYFLHAHFNRDFLFEDDEEVQKDEDSLGLNVGAGFDFAASRRVLLGMDARYHKAFDAFAAFDFVTMMFNVGIRLGLPAVPEEHL